MEMAFNIMLMLLMTGFTIILVDVKNPFLGSLFLILITLLIMAEVSFMVSQWLAYLLMLLFLGGMMVLFLYVTSIMASLKFNLKLSSKYMILFLVSGPWMLVNSDGPGLPSTKFVMISGLFNADSYIFIFLLLLYLLLGLVAVVSICKKFEGALKSKVNENQ